MNRVYVCIDLKSFYASVECRERNLNPLTTNLVVADESRTSKTVCLAITPTLKQYGLSGRERLFEVLKKVNDVNKQRLYNAPNHKFTAKSYEDTELKKDKSLELDLLIVPPRMAYYMEYSINIYQIYLKYLSKDDIYVYSIDEVFCDITNYLHMYNMNAKELVTKIIKDIYDTTGITATAGIGTNLYLAKVAMDIVAKHVEANEFGVRIAELDEMSYRKTLWNYEPITDFWRVGRGYAKKLYSYNIKTMGDVAIQSEQNEDLLYKLFGINAELLIDHAWGYEPTTLKNIKNYKTENKSISSGQVLHEPYSYDKARIIIKEMSELLTLELVEKGFATNHIVLSINYDVQNLTKPNISKLYNGEVKEDRYGRCVPKPASRNNKN